MGQIGQLLMPDIYGSFQQGVKDGQERTRRKTLAQYVQPALNGDKGALAQIYGVDPDAGMKMEQNAQQHAQQSKQFADEDLARLAKHARMVTALADSGDMQGAQSLYETIYPEAASKLGADLPKQLNPQILAHMKSMSDAMDPQKQQPLMSIGNGTVFDPNKREVVYKGEPQLPGSIQELAYLKEHPELAAFQRQQYGAMHPRQADGGDGRPKPRFGWQYASDGSLEPVKGGPYDQSSEAQGLSPEAVDNAAWSYIGTGKLPSIGRGKEGVAQRTTIMNEAARVAKEAGVSPAELQTVPGRNKALQASLTNLQKTSDVMEKSEQAFLNNTQTALQISGGLSRADSPVINKWVLGGKDALGDPKVRALDAAITTMAVDYARIMSGATGAGGTPISTAEEAKALIKKELSDKSLRAVVAVLEQDIKGQQAAVHNQRGKILGAMQQMHDEAAPTTGGSMTADDSDPLELLK